MATLHIPPSTGSHATTSAQTKNSRPAVRTDIFSSENKGQRHCESNSKPQRRGVNCDGRRVMTKPPASAVTQGFVLEKFAHTI